MTESLLKKAFFIFFNDKRVSTAHYFLSSNLCNVLEMAEEILKSLSHMNYCNSFSETKFHQCYQQIKSNLAK